ncbi:MAG TPA: hypothetical protein VGE04_14660 [Chloroflexia bacterium]
MAEEIDPESVVAEFTYSPPRAASLTTEGVAAGGTAPTRYRIIVTNEMDAYDDPGSLAEMFATPLEVLKVGGDNFNGTSRRAAKLSIAKAPVENFADLKDLIATLPSTNAMVNHKPKIKDSKDSDRVKEERRNVRLRVWLYAASREDDNDFHFILGRAPGLTPKTFMTMELSGLPRANSQVFARLKAARDAFKTFLSDHLPGLSYQFYDPPIPVEIEGSLFFDITHAKGTPPGPKKLRPNMPVIWEVHPISKIVFEP